MGADVVEVGKEDLLIERRVKQYLREDVKVGRMRSPGFGTTLQHLLC
jgi:hypothetical protein